MQLLQWLSCLKAGNTPHAVFLVGPAGSGKKEYARQAAALYLLGREDTKGLSECPFFQELPDYAIKTVRACCEALNRTAQTQNALLKTLEEPPEEALLILTGNEQAVLPTIRSRCMLVRVGSEDRAKLAARLSARGVAPDRAMLAAALSDGVPSLAERYAGEEYMAFRAQALPVIEEALFGVTPFSQAAALLERREDGKKKVGKDGLCDFIDMLLSLLRDALLQQLGDSDSRNLDAQALQNRVAGHFTTAEIQCMIAETLQKRRALTEYGGAPSLVLDALLASIRKREK